MARSRPAPRLPLLTRVVVAVLVLALGASTGAAAAVVHARWWGLALAWAVVLTVVVALPGRWWGRFTYAVGWTLPLALAMTPRGEGDYLVSASLTGYAYLATVPVLLLASALPDCSGTGRVRAPDAPDGDTSTGGVGTPS